MNVQVYLHVMCDSKCFPFSAVVKLLFFLCLLWPLPHKVVNLIFYYHDLYHLIFKVNSFQLQRIADENTKNTFPKLF